MLITITFIVAYLYNMLQPRETRESVTLFFLSLVLTVRLAFPRTKEWHEQREYPSREHAHILWLSCSCVVVFVCPSLQEKKCQHILRYVRWYIVTITTSQFYIFRIASSKHSFDVDDENVLSTWIEFKMMIKKDSSYFLRQSLTWVWGQCRRGGRRTTKTYTCGSIMLTRRVEAKTTQGRTSRNVHETRVGR